MLRKRMKRKNDFIKKEAQEYLENFMRPIKGTISGEVKR